MLRHLAGIAMLSLSLVACSGSGSGSGDGSTTTKKPAPEVVDTTTEKQYTVTVAGARQFSFDGRIPVRVLTRLGEGESLQFSVASVTLPTPLPAEGAETAAPEVALLGMYEGDGKYRVPAGIGRAPTTGDTLPAPGSDTLGYASVMQVTFATEATAVRYGYLAEPCTVELDDDARAGTADCPALVAPDGARVSMKVSWKP